MSDSSKDSAAECLEENLIIDNVSVKFPSPYDLIGLYRFLLEREDSRALIYSTWQLNLDKHLKLKTENSASEYAVHLQSVVKKFTFESLLVRKLDERLKLALEALDNAKDRDNKKTLPIIQITHLRELIAILQENEKLKFMKSCQFHELSIDYIVEKNLPFHPQFSAKQSSLRSEIFVSEEKINNIIETLREEAIDSQD